MRRAQDALTQRPRGVESALNLVQPSALIYPQVILIPMKCHGDVAGNWHFFKQ